MTAFLFVFVPLLLTSLHGVQSAGDADVLLEFKRGVRTEFAPWEDNQQITDTLADWAAENAGNMCSWTGITCDSTGEHVTSIQLSAKNLRGTITPALGGLQSLEQLDLSANLLSGTIPESLSKCKRLQTLDVSFNLQLKGSIPSSFGGLIMLTSLKASFNLLDGDLPPELGSLTSLQELRMEFNRFTGTIPATFGMLRNLTDLDLGYNFLNGSVPSSLASCSSLTRVALGLNDLSGEVPLFFLKMENLTNMYLDGNRFQSIGSLAQQSRSLVDLKLNYNPISGTIPSQFFTFLPALKSLDMSTSNISGEIPEFGSPCLLERLYLNDNQLVGAIPTSLGNCSRLGDLVIASNNLTGEFPGEFGTNLPMLVNFDLSFNQIQGNIPKSLASCVNLTRLDLGVNRFTGNLPPELANLTQLSFMAASTNSLKGPIPLEYFQMVNLDTLDVARNGLSGTLPQSCKLNSLSKLDLSSNNLSGEIPSCLGTNSSKLWTLDLSNNMFYGEVPSSLGTNAGSLYYLDLSHNSLVGKLPAALDNCSSLSIFSAAWNHLQELGMSFDKMSKLVYLQLSNNMFTGDLSHVSRNLTNLRVVNFRDNGFSSNLPTAVCGWESVTVMSFASNKLEGEIPTCMWTSLGRLKVLDLSGNALSGPIPGAIERLQGFIGQTASAGWHTIQGLACPECPPKMEFQLVIKGSTRDYINYYDNMIFFDVSSNRLEGEIPVEFGRLVGMKYLNLSGNMLSGSIPSGLNGMVNLESLDVSSNGLRGNIPLTFATMDQLQVLRVAHNNLSGRVQVAQTFYTRFKASDFEGTGLCGAVYPLPPCGEDTPSGGVHDSEGDGDSWLSRNASTWAMLIGFCAGLGTTVFYDYSRWRKI